MQAGEQEEITRKLKSELRRVVLHVLLLLFLPACM